MALSIDGAYAVKIFLDHHPGRGFSLGSLACQCGISEAQLALGGLSESKDEVFT